MRKLYNFLLIVALFAVCVEAEEPLKLSITQVIDRAKGKNLEVLLMQERIREVSGRTLESKSRLLPRVDGMFSFSRQVTSSRAAIWNEEFPFFKPLNLSNTLGPYDLWYGGIIINAPLLNREQYFRHLSFREKEELAQSQAETIGQEAIRLALSCFFHIFHSKF